jgi:hypothetical protein
MATKLAYKTGNWTDNTIWGTATETGAATTTVTMAATRYTSVFTAPSTSNSCLGALVTPVNLYSLASSTYTLTLQEYNGATWVNKSTSTYTDDDLMNLTQYVGVYAPITQVFMKFATPYAYTTTTAGYYRFSLARTAVTSSPTFYGETASLLWAMTIDDRNGAPTSSENAIIAGSVTTPITVTVGGTVACGSNTGTDGTLYSAHSIVASPMSARALDICLNGIVTADVTQSTTLTLNGAFFVNSGGEFHLGTEANPIPIAYTANLILAPKTNYNLGAAVFGYRIGIDGTQPISFVGTAKTFKTEYVSGTGTTASPLVVAASTNWQVGDLIAFSGSTYDKKEHKYIKTIVTTNTFILADSVGGAESALANAHTTNDWVLSITRNVGISSGADNKKWFLTCSCTGNDKLIMKYCSFKNIGGSTTATYLSAASVSRNGAKVEGISVTDLGDTAIPVHSYLFGITTTSQDVTFKDNVCYLPSTSRVPTAAYYLFLKKNDPAKVTNFYQIGSYYYGIYLTGYSATYDNFHFRNTCAAASGSYIYGGFYAAGAGNTLVDCTTNGSRCAGLTITAGGTDNIFRKCQFGTIYANQTQGDISLASTGDFSTATFDSCLFTSATPFYSLADTYGYLMNAYGSKYSFQYYNSLTDNGEHRVYTPGGVLVRTAAGLTDTTVRTTGGSCYRFESQSTDNRLEWVQNIPTGDIQNKTMTIGAWVKINSATYYAGTHQMPRLTVDYDNGTVVYAEAGQVVGDWQFIFLSFTPTTTFPQITVTCSSKTDATTTDAYVYFTDFSILYPAGYQLDLGKLSSFAFGAPLMPTIATNLSAADVWAADPTKFGADTVGEKVNKIKNDTGLIGALL